MPSASLGHYASLSFVVIGREQRTGDRRKKKAILLWERLFRPEPACHEPVEWVEGQQRSCALNDFYGFKDLPLTARSVLSLSKGLPTTAFYTFFTFPFESP